MKKVHVFGGGTVFHVRPHLAITAPAYGGAARQIEKLVSEQGYATRLHLTKMAGGRDLETNEDVAKRIAEVVSNLDTKVIFLSTAFCDWGGGVYDTRTNNTTDSEHGHHTRAGQVPCHHGPARSLEGSR
jgi:hypothetical protein